MKYKNHLTEIEVPELMSLTAGYPSWFNPITRNIKSLQLYASYLPSLGLKLLTGIIIPTLEGCCVV